MIKRRGASLQHISSIRVFATLAVGSITFALHTSRIQEQSRQFPCEGSVMVIGSILVY